MAVVLGAVVAVGGFALSHGDYSDYGNYGDYSDYSDASVKLEKQIESLEEELEAAANTLDQYKLKNVNPRLSSEELKQEDAMEVSEKAMDQDVNESIDRKMKNEILKETGDLQKEMQQIEELLGKIEKIEQEQL